MIKSTGFFWHRSVNEELIFYGLQPKPSLAGGGKAFNFEVTAEIITKTQSKNQIKSML
ncbi:MAG: hypothetical protein AAB680_04800 [Pseudomonadota bacterium]